ncbi:MAG: hypothetical protein Q9163_003401 [Psora crenata]
MTAFSKIEMRFALAHRVTEAMAIYNPLASLIRQIRHYSAPLNGSIPAAKQKYVPTSGTYPKGFLVSGIHVGVKPSNTRFPDLALLISERPCAAAAVFTKNLCQAAPVTVSRQTLQNRSGEGIRAIVANSGCANAVTGKGGLEDASRMTSTVDSHISPSPNSGSSTLVMSTGVIGQRLPIQKILAAIPKAFSDLSRTHDAWLNTARSICTTDTFPKLMSTTFTLPSSRREYSLAGMSKGAGMIHPNMATLLGILCTDAPIPASILQPCLLAAVEKSFNAISIDGDSSTNDTVALLANGAAGGPPITADTPDAEAFKVVLTNFAQRLSQLIVRDGEGATKFVRIKVVNSAKGDDAKLIASTIARSPLVKTALYGKDANWGRILCAIGYTQGLSPGAVILEKTSVSFVPTDGSKTLNLLLDGEPQEVDETRASEILEAEDLEILVDLGGGEKGGREEASYWTCDFSHEYITINGDYRTPLASRDVNTSLPSPTKSNGAVLEKDTSEKPKGMEYHRQVLQNRLAEDNYLHVFLPLGATGASLLYITIQLIRRTVKIKRTEPGPHKIHAPPTRGHGSYRDDVRPPGQAENVAWDDDDERQALALCRTKTTESVLQVNRPRGQLFVVLIEVLTVLALAVLELAFIFTHVWDHQVVIAGFAGLVSWCYILILASTRLWTTNHTSTYLPNLWYQTAWLYGFQWILNALIFRSAMIHPNPSGTKTSAIVEFGLTSILALIALTTREGNKTVLLEHEDNIEPSREPLANLFSTWTFGWVDAIVWRGYKKTFELQDVWNLAARDKAAAVLADFRQFRKTNALAWHLLQYFKRELMIQALWAVVSGLFTFAPTLLLKTFLEFVENPAATPVNAAWFYMTLLALSSCIKAVTDGQALWLGRRVCIRLRAIIVGEVYAKALRRRAGAGRDTVLGGKKEKGNEPSKEFKQPTGVDGNANNEKNSTDSQVNVGTIINLMAVDSFKVSEISAYLHFLWGSTPVQLVLCIALLYHVLGWSSLAGIIMMVLVIPINLVIAKQFTKTQKKVMAATDVRIHTTNEILQNIRIIKYFAWEQRFGQIVSEKRQAELRALRDKYILWTAAAGIWFGVPVLITFFSFLLYTVVEERPLVPSIAFTALSLFGILRYPLDQLADMVAHVQESKVSVDRIEEFLNEDETEKYEQLSHERGDGDPEVVIGFDNATLTWGSKDARSADAQKAFHMIDLDVRFMIGRLNIVAGPTGSGKTSLLMALLGEMTLLHGSVYLPHGRSREELVPDSETGLTESIAYCAQQAWLVNDSVRQNILFAAPFNEARYRAVIAACALERDFEILDKGDSTLVGEKGIALSGGQKQRISLARALYSTSRHVLLDDCLSAVDSHTAKHIFEFCIVGPLMFGRTCILVTHNVTLCVPRSHYLVYLMNGKIAAQGTPDDVISSGALGDEILKSRPGSKGESKNHSRIPSSADLESQKNSNANGHTLGHKDGTHDSVKAPLDKSEAQGENNNDRMEGKATGSVNIRVIQMYLAAMGPWYYWILALGAFALQQLGSVGANVCIRAWANAYTRKSQSFGLTDAGTTSNKTYWTRAISLSSTSFTNGALFWNLGLSTTSESSTMLLTPHKDRVDAWHYLLVYACLGLFYIFISLFREALIFWGSLRASCKLHEKLFHAVTRAKLQFFDTTPLGQLMNRFSRDIETMDQDVSPVAVGVLGCLFSLVSIVVLICVITPRFLIAGFFITLVYFAIGQFYLRSSRDLKRLESVQRSPIYQHFGETLTGMVTIRAYGDERRFIRDNQLRVDTHNRPFIYLWAANRWLALRVDCAGALVAFFAGVFVILSIKTIDAGSAGLSLTYAVMFTENVLWLVRLYSSNEQNMNSVERIKEYVEVDQEAQAIIKEARPPGGWPSQGAIQFCNYTTRYRPELDPVLRDLTFNILPGERVGIVGRTGAGKSSLALALFRGLEAESGKILIDDLNIGLIGLQDLREAITIVPQDPTLFTGTLRSNLDPFGLFTDEEIFSTLRRVQLIGAPLSATASSPASLAPPVTLTPPDSLASSADGRADELDLAKKMTNTRENANIFTDLYSPIAESGSNLSQGQRQLLCLARALLKAPRVLLMDEATASIDYATDEKIQDTLREVKESTIITIAHRLQTIIDYDKVLVLDKGKVIEFDAPWNLIQRQEGIFHGMCEMSGDLDSLVKAAKEAEKKKKLIDV